MLKQNTSLYYTECTLGGVNIHTLKCIFNGNHACELKSVRKSQHNKFGGWEDSIEPIAPLNNVKEPIIKIGYKKQSDITHIYYWYENICPTEIRIIQNNDKKIEIYKGKSEATGQWNSLTSYQFKKNFFSTVVFQFFMPQNTMEVQDKFFKDFNYLLKDGLFSDGTFQSSDGVSFKIHKCVLACRSPVLKAHFDNDSIESRTGIIKSIFDAEVLTELFNYIYSGQESIDLYKVPDKLLVAADFYQLSELKSLCEYAVIRQLTVENVIDTLKLADLYSASNLQALAMEFIQIHAKFIFTTQAWARLDSVKLLKALYEYDKKDDLDSENEKNEKECKTFTFSDPFMFK